MRYLTGSRLPSLIIVSGNAVHLDLQPTLQERQEVLLSPTPDPIRNPIWGKLKILGLL